MPGLTLLSPAKLNLFLHITGRRDNGYHELQTVFQLLDYGDDIHIAPRDDGQIVLSAPLAGVADSDNLIIKAASALKEYIQCHPAAVTPATQTLGTTITLHKRLPLGGGLGGGSSNAATVLLGLNHLWHTQLTLAQLADIGLQLGADVPVFVHGQSAWAEGIGEQLSPIQLPECWYLVVKPQCTVSTEEIFSHQELTRDTAAITVAAFFEQGGHNDCQYVVTQQYPEVAQSLQWLQHYGPAQLTGTGACVFATFPDENQARAVFNQTPTKWESFIAKGINRSPLRELLCE